MIHGDFFNQHSYALHDLLKYHLEKILMVKYNTGFYDCILVHSIIWNQSWSLYNKFLSIYTTFQVIQAFSIKQTKVIIDERYFKKKLQFLITCKLMEKQKQKPATIKKSKCYNFNDKLVLSADNYLLNWNEIWMLTLFFYYYYLLFPSCPLFIRLFAYSITAFGSKKK